MLPVQSFSFARPASVSRCVKISFVPAGRRCQRSWLSEKHQQPSSNLHTSGATPPSSTAPPKSGNIYFSGIQPTGRLHLGNYFGAIKQWVDIADSLARLPPDAEGEMFLSIVDLHALTNQYRGGGGTDPSEVQKSSKQQAKQSGVSDSASSSTTLVGDQLRASVLETARVLLASGLLPHVTAPNPRVHLFVQSDLAGEHAALSWILSCMTPLGPLRNMIQFKEKARQRGEEEHATLGLLAYPVLQSSDVLLYRADHVPVGADQAQHLELVQKLAHRFNSLHSALPAVFPIPQPLFPHQNSLARVMSLRDGKVKMSKSDPSEASRIHLDDSVEEIERKISKAKSDSLPAVSFSPSERPEVSNLISLLAACKNISVESIVDEWKMKAHSHEGSTTPQMSAFKSETAKAISQRLEPIRTTAEKLRRTPEITEKILISGATRARQRSNATLLLVQQCVGLRSGVVK